jgi:hypothetical protein
MDGDKNHSNIEVLSFIEGREKDQKILESIILGESTTFGSEWNIPEEFSSPLVELLEELPFAKAHYKEMDEKLKGRNLDEALDFVKSGEIVLFSPADEDGKILQYTPGKLVHGKKKNTVYEVLGIDWRDKEKVMDYLNSKYKLIMNEIKELEKKINDLENPEKDVEHNTNHTKGDMKTYIDSLPGSTTLKIAKKFSADEDITVGAGSEKRSREWCSKNLDKAGPLIRAMIDREKQLDDKKRLCEEYNKSSSSNIEWRKTPLNEKLVQFSREVPNSNNLRYCLVFEPKDTTVASWCALPYGSFGGTKEWYPLCRDKIGFKEATNQVLFSIIDSLNAEVDANCKVISKDTVARASKVIINTGRRFGPKINPSYKTNLMLVKYSEEESFSKGFCSDKEKNKPMVTAWTLCCLLRNLGIIHIRNAKYEKISGGASRDNISIEFIQDKWPERITKKMNHIINKITGASRRYMLCEPLPHRVNKPGGYISEHLQKTFLKPPSSKYTEPSQYAINALNLLQKTEWCINEIVLEQAEKYLKLEVLEEETGLKQLRWQDDKATKWARKLCDREDGSHFWHPWCFDWRGRMYSVSNVLSPIGNDLSRGLIQFSEYLPVDKEALNWLKIYLVELFNGVDFGSGKANKKASFVDRIKWVDKNEYSILEIAKNPSENFKDTGKPVWWDFSGNGSGLGAGATTFRRLAVALDYSHAVEHSESRIPVQQDASSNWLQHTAMMLLDVDLAKVANLTAKVDTDEPEDVYTKVADQLGIIWRDKKESNKEHKYINILMEPEVNKLLRRRSVVKTPLLAVAYGGKPDAKDFLEKTGAEEWNEKAREYENVSGLMKKIQEVVVNNKKYGKEEWKKINELDLARTILIDCMAALEQVAPNYDGIQKNIKQIVKEKAPSGRNRKLTERHAMKWETPIIKFKVKNYKGVTEDEKLAASRQVTPAQYWSQKVTIYFNNNNLYSVHDGIKGGPPNFVHSIDAAHLQLSILRMNDKKSNIPLSIIHDSYGCHAANIEMLRKSVISAFKEIHLPKGRPNDQPFNKLRQFNGVSQKHERFDFEDGVRKSVDEEVFEPVEIMDAPSLKFEQEEFADTINIDEAIYMIG